MRRKTLSPEPAALKHGKEEVQPHKTRQRSPKGKQGELGTACSACCTPTLHILRAWLCFRRSQIAPGTPAPALCPAADGASLRVLMPELVCSRSQGREQSIAINPALLSCACRMVPSSPSSHHDHHHIIIITTS